ncbi:Serine/threonine protein kinase with TPR repeats [Candidatus Sulfotelmatobacter kueseliae]|uniref:Serine/threonine protein kinase with TPR repeats n=1 Tax=Candidatus Sulfotelmatobacter kueseliae TaxID=2042962 RepID=A0A2U3KC95_9BACT|nr:Serine/threonine protein kinase with TPR repeats [Candidatus Sulfotelmatobacter kueseliae]
MIGQTISHYRIVEKIGAGGMGEVYRARDEHLARDVAIKVLPPGTLTDGSARKHFHKEALILSQLNHPNVATIHDFDTQQNVDFLVMEYIPGITLSEKVAAGALPEKEVLRLGVQLAEGLAAAHEHGVVHRDLKPGNLRVTSDGRLKILDFGLAKLWRPVTASAATESLSEPQAMAGTLPYMAPEQLLGGEIDARTDIHAAGLVLYEMATGRYPFADVENSQLIGAILHRPPRPPTFLKTRLSPELERIIGKCLEKEPENRYQSAKELAIDLRRLQTPSAAKVAEVPVAGRKLWKVLVPAALVLVIAAIVGAFYLRSRQAAARLTDKDTVVLSDFDNKTGDPIFDDTLKTALNVSLRQSPFLNVLSDQQIAETLQQMTRPADTKLTPAVTRELCQRTGSKAYVAGTIGGLGSEYVLGLKAVNCQNGDTLAEEQVTAASKEKVLDALGEAASKLRTELGESLASVQKFDVPLAQATTSSLEALKAYSLGRRAFHEKGYAAALPYDQRAIELDPNFALGYDWVGLDYSSLGKEERAREYLTKAFQLRAHASEWEKLDITIDYYVVVTGELDKAAQTTQEAIETYPQIYGFYFSLGEMLAGQGQYEKATEIERQGKLLRPDQVPFYDDLAAYALALQRFDDARQIIREAQARKLDDIPLHLTLYALAFLGADSVAMAEQQQWFAGKPSYENLGLSLASDTEAYGGHLGKARELTKRAVDSAIRADSRERGALWQANAALEQAAFGNSTEARQTAAEALKLAPASQGAEVEAALAFAMVGDMARAESLAQDLGKRFPLDTQMRSLWLPAIQGQLALYRKNPTSALNALQAPSAIELGNTFVNSISCLYPVYVRGEAYLAAGQGSAAAAEFQKILDHSGIVSNCWTGALAHLGVARANALQARTSQGADADAARVRALTAYKDFLTLWKDADLDIPILKQAKSEYARLQ